MFHGLLIKESLRDTSILDRLTITKEERWDVENATEGQPAVWNVAWFDVEDDRIDATAQSLSEALENGKWYLDLSSEAEKVVIFPGKVFRYAKGNAAGREDAKAFARSIDIPESQLDWQE